MNKSDCFLNLFNKDSYFIFFPSDCSLMQELDSRFPNLASLYLLIPLSAAIASYCKSVLNSRPPHTHTHIHARAHFEINGI